jgi:hypothetical protein
MLFGQNREELRRFYLEAWRKYRNKLPLQPMEAMIAEVVSQHPEYHALLENEEKAVSEDFSADNGQGNPFMHMGMYRNGIRQTGETSG